MHPNSSKFIQMRFEPLRWNYYRACRILFQDVFDISEHGNFATDWSHRCEKRSFVVLYCGTVIAFILVDTSSRLRYICVHAEFQKERLGSTLLTRVLASCVDDRSLRLVTANKEWLVAWYTRHGFRAETLYHDESGEFAGAEMVRRQRSRSQLQSHKN